MAHRVFPCVLGLLGALLALWVGACSGPKGAARSNPHVQSVHAHHLADAARSTPITSRCTQVIVVLGADDAPPDGARFVRVALFESRVPGAPMELTLGPWAGVVGASGIAQPGSKREGDRRTPSGRFTITELFGTDPDFASRMPYKVLSDEDAWCEDPASPLYNQWIRVPPPEKESERWTGGENLYRHGGVINYNRDPVRPGAGSGIFIHRADPRGAGTFGCVGLDQRDLDAILLRLAPARAPEIVIATPATLARATRR